MYTQPIIELNVHGMRAEEAIKHIQKKINEAGAGVYRIRVIHGYNRGTSIRSAIREEFDYYGDPKVLRVEMGDNEGITDLILREY